MNLRRGRRVIVWMALAALIVSVLACDSPFASTTPFPAGIVQVTPDPSGSYSSTQVNQAADIILKRLDAVGLNNGMDFSGPLLTFYLKDPADKPTVLKLATQVGALEFFEADSPLAAGSAAPENAEPVFTDKDVTSGLAAKSQQTGLWEVHILFNREATKRFAGYTGSHIGAYLAIAQDGIVLAAPKIMAAIPNGDAVITGQLDQTAAKTLAAEMIGGPLPLKLVDASTVTPAP